MRSKPDRTTARAMVTLLSWVNEPTMVCMNCPCLRAHLKIAIRGVKRVRMFLFKAL